MALFTYSTHCFLSSIPSFHFISFFAFFIIISSLLSLLLQVRTCGVSNPWPEPAAFEFSVPLIQYWLYRCGESINRINTLSSYVCCYSNRTHQQFSVCHKSSVGILYLPWVWWISINLDWKLAQSTGSWFEINIFRRENFPTNFFFFWKKCEIRIFSWQE